MNSPVAKVSYLLLLAILVAPLVSYTASTLAPKPVTPPASTTGLTQEIQGGNYTYATTIEPAIVVLGGKVYVPYVNVTNPTYAEGNVSLYIYDPATNTGTQLAVDTSGIAIDVNAVAGKDSILIAVTEFPSTASYRDLYVYLYNVTEKKLVGPFTVSATKYYEEYPVVAYNPIVDMYAVAYFLSGTTASPLPITQFNVTLLKFSS
ncbi:MAG: hypothetical protein ACP5HP_04145, partial [Thermogladius sp.]